MTTTVAAGLLVVRLAVGLTIAAHGYAKIFRGGRLMGTARWFESIGMRPGRLHAPLAALTEIGGGVLFACGLFTPLAAAAILALMLVAAWTVHRQGQNRAAASRRSPRSHVGRSRTDVHWQCCHRYRSGRGDRRG